jgi:hypothetical protein
MSLYKGWDVIATAFFLKTTYLAKCCKKTTYFTILTCFTASAINLPQSYLMLLIRVILLLRNHKK